MHHTCLSRINGVLQYYEDIVFIWMLHAMIFCHEPAKNV